jgi:hypothetical protein
VRGVGLVERVDLVVSEVQVERRDGLGQVLRLGSAHPAGASSSARPSLPIGCSFTISALAKARSLRMSARPRESRSPGRWLGRTGSGLGVSLPLRRG